MLPFYMESTPAVSSRQGRTKNEYIETLRGLAVIILTLGHAIGVNSSGGMKVADDSIWRYLFFTFNYIGIPLFTVIAGRVYALRPAGRGEAGAFMRRKVRRLLLPMACVGTLYFFMQYVTPGTNRSGVLSELWKIYVLPYTFYWYLWSLFLLFGFVVLLDRRAACTTLRAWSGWMAVALAGCYAERFLSPNLPNVFGVWGALCLLPYFLLGVGLGRFTGRLASPPMKRIYLAGFVIGFAVRQLVWFATRDPFAVRALFLHVPIGMLASAFLLTSGWHNRFLAWMGGYAYGIYLFHGFGTSAGRILLLRAGIDSPTAVFLFSAVLGLVVPIAAVRVSDRFPLLRTLILGERYAPHRPACIVRSH